MKKKLNINRPKISSEEITQRKNFDSVLKNHASLSGKPFFKKPWFLSGVIAVTIAVVCTIVLLNKDVQHQSENKIPLSEIVNDSLSLIEFYENEEAKPCINPPLKGVNVPYTTYKVIAEKGASLDFKTGSELVVPKNAFVDNSGKPIKGEVELRYREFHDPIDFFVSGIPMTYDSAGVMYHFESAGMMEILAYQDGKPVNMAKGKSITVELASNYKGTEYNLYKLDTVKNNWECLGKDKVLAGSASIGKSLSTQKMEAPAIQQTSEYKALEIKKVEVQKEKELQIATLPKTIPEPKKPVLARKEKYTFNIEVDAKEYPELVVYKGLLFEVGDENKKFSKSLYDITWDEALVKEGTKKGENYRMTLIKGLKKYDFIVYPVYEGGNYEKAMNNFQEKFVKYNAALEKRRVEEKRIEENYQTKLIALKRQQDQLELKWKQEQANLLKQMSTEEKVMRMFAINSFGVFNCDKPSVYPKGINCSANLTKDKNVKLMCYSIYLVDNKKNGLFTYYKNPIAKFSFDPDSKNMLWTIEDGVLYWLKPEQFSNITASDGLNNLKLNRVEEKFSNLVDMKKYFDL